ncbi:MAG: hypothetical protein WBH00_23210 [Xanthobacteraceae bacterium]
MTLTEPEQRELVDLLRWNAARFRLPALPATWPEWMTPEKRQAMADRFDNAATELEQRTDT